MYDFRKLASLKHLCACCLVLLGLGYSVPVIAGTKSAFNSVPVRQTGNTAQIGFPGAPPSVFPGTGNVTPVSGSGWYTAGNYGVAPPATGPTLYGAIDGSVVFAGVKYPWQAGYQISKSGLVSAAGALLSAAGGPYTAAALFAAPFLLDWLTKAGGRVAPDGVGIERTDPTLCTVAPCYEYRSSYDNGSNNTPWYPTYKQACDFVALIYNNRQSPGWQAQSSMICTLTGPLSGQIDVIGASAQIGYAGTAGSTRGAVPSTAQYLPSSMDDIAPYMARSDVNPDGRVIQELLDKGADIPMPAPTVTGPASVVGSETTTVNPDGTKTVSRTTYNFNTSGDTITNTSNVTTTNNYNTSNVITGTTTTTATPVAAEAKPSECETNPQSNGCRTDEFDTPTQEIPKTTRNVTFNAENLGFAGGACPADKFMTPHGMASIKVYDWAGTCDKVTTYAKPMILALATFAALMIIFVGKPE